MAGTGSIAERLGGWSVRHRMVAILGWLLFVVLAGLGAACPRSPVGSPARSLSVDGGLTMRE